MLAVAMLRDTPASSSRLLTPRTPFELFEIVEELPDEAIGELVFDCGKHGGLVFVEHHRVCWAAAPGLSRRLVDLIRERSPVSLRSGSGTLEQLYRRAKSEGRPFGELLVTCGVLSADDLREALRTHTLESIESILAYRMPARWSPRRTGGYSAQFTFAAVELLAAIARRHAPELSQQARGELRRVLQTGDRGLALLRGDAAEPTPIALYGEPFPSARLVVEIGKWAAGVLDVGDAIARAAHPSEARDRSEALTRGRCIFAGIASTGADVVAWRSGAIAYVVAPEGKGSVGRVLGRLTRQSGMAMHAQLRLSRSDDSHDEE